MLPVARYGVVRRARRLRREQRRRERNVDAATADAAALRPARDRPDSAGDLRGQRRGRLFDQHAVAAERRQQHPALVAHEARIASSALPRETAPCGPGSKPSRLTVAT